MSLVSIITPVYNAEKSFKETLKSVLNQSFKDFEWIIIDDCSTDKSFEVISNFTHFKNYLKAPVVKLVRKLPSKCFNNKSGLVDTFNRSLKCDHYDW